jgi:hypothetical protein
MAAVHFPRLVFKYPFDEAAAYDAEARGYLAYSSVELSNGARYPVVFYDPVRLQQDLEVEVSDGRAFIAEPGMIVVPEVTLDRMQAAIDRLFQDGFFDSLKSEPDQGREASREAREGELSGGGTGNGAAAGPGNGAIGRSSPPTSPSNHAGPI